MMTRTHHAGADGPARCSSCIGPVLMALIACTAWLAGCDTTPANTLFDEAPPLRDDPVVTAVEPSSGALAGIGTVTILGENFSTTPSENLVYFDDVRAEVLSASPTELVVETPRLPRSDIQIRVNVIGAEHFSNSVTYALESAVEEVGGVADFEESFAIATDEDHNLYVSLFANNASVGIKRILPDGTREDYISSTFKWDALAMKEGRLYGVRNVRAVFRFPEGGGDQEVWAVADDRSARFTELAVDQEGDVWVGGTGGNLYRIDESGRPEPVPMEGPVTGLAAHGGAIYAARTEEGISSVWRFPVTAGGLETGEKLLDLPPGVRAQSLAAARDGSLFVGTDADDPLVLIEADGTADTFYEGLLEPPAFSLAWGEGPNLFMSRTDLPGSPSTIIRINTQRDGPN